MLLNSLLLALPVYYPFFFKAPEYVIKILLKLQHKFLSGYGGGGEGIEL